MGGRLQELGPILPRLQRRSIKVENGGDFQTVGAQAALLFVSHVFGLAVSRQGQPV